MLKKLFSFLFFALCIVSTLSAQELKVKSFEYKERDLSARQPKVKDINGKECALLKVRLALPDAKFKGEITGTPEFKTGEYWVYLSPGAKKLNMSLGGYLPLDIVFGDYGITRLESLNTYMLIIELPNSNKMQRVKFNITPKDATLKVDNLEFMLDDGSVEIPLTVGTHSVIAYADYYKGHMSNISVDGKSEYSEVDIKLSQAFSKLNVSSDPSGAEVVLVGKKENSIGTTPLVDKPLISGEHTILIRKAGFKPVTKTIDVKNEDPVYVDVKLSSLIDATITSVPRGARISFNGQDNGVTPIKITEVAGTYPVKLKAKNYYDYNGSINLDGSQSEILIKMKRQYFKKYGGYLEGFAQTGSMMGFGGSLGMYLSDLNIEGSYIIGLKESEEIFWNSSNISSKPSSFTYKPVYMGGKIGYGIAFGRSVRFTPQVGFGVTEIVGQSCSVGQTHGVENSYVGSASVGAKFLFVLANSIVLAITPEYDMAVVRGKAYDSLEAASSTIKSWGNGFNYRLGLNIFF